MGVFHKQSDEDKEYDYLEGLTRIKKFASIIFLAPLKGETNVDKMKRFISDVLSSLNRSMLVYILRNNFSKYIEDKIENTMDVSTIDDEEESIDENYISNIISEAKNDLQNDFEFSGNKFVKVTIAKFLVEFRKFSNYIKSPDIVKEYSLSNVIQQILLNFVDYTDNVNQRLSLQSSEGEAPSIMLDKDALKENFEEIYYSKMVREFDRLTFIPAKSNIDENYAKVPHGNSYNALVRRLRYGGYYSSNIDESYYSSCSNINITFTRNINRLSKCDLVSDLLRSAIIIKGIKCDNLGLKYLLEKIINNINDTELSKLLVYDYALQDSESRHTSFAGCFNGMLDNCRTFINTDGRPIDIDRWADALSIVYNNAIEMTFNYDIMII